MKNLTLGRAATLQTNRLRTLTDGDIADMVARYVSGESQLSIARDYGLNQPKVSQIVRPHAPPARSRMRARGAKNGASKLTDDQVRGIRSTHETGEIAQVTLAQRYAVSASAISDILRSKTHVGVEELKQK